MAKHYVKWEYYENGVNSSISGETVNEIIEENAESSARLVNRT